MLPNGSVSVGDTMYFRRISDLRVDHDLTQRKVADYLNMNLEVYRRYARRSSRYYFYRGSLYGAREALEIWAEEHGGSGAALA